MGDLIWHPRSAVSDGKLMLSHHTRYRFLHKHSLLYRLPPVEDSCSEVVIYHNERYVLYDNLSRPLASSAIAAKKHPSKAEERCPQASN